MWRKREHLKSPCHLAHFYPEINTLITLERINATRLYRWVANWQPNWQPEKSGWELATGRVRFWPKGSVMPEDADVGNLEHISPTFCKALQAISSRAFSFIWAEKYQGCLCGKCRRKMRDYAHSYSCKRRNSVMKEEGKNEGQSRRVAVSWSLAASDSWCSD